MKRRTMSRLAALLLAAGLSLALFGCTPKTDESQPASDPAASADTQTPEASSDDTAQEPASSDSQPASQEDEATPAEEEKQAVTEKVKEQLAEIQEQSEQLQADGTTADDSEAEAKLNEAADELDAYLKEEVEGSSN